jgi:protein-disulfide isomerase/predicted nucleic acid-binding Zn ribbon protein
MANGDSGHARPNKNQRRELAREKARLNLEKQRKRDRRTRWAVQGGIALVLVAVIAVVGLVIWNGVRPAGPGPANMASDGIHIGEGFKATPTGALASDADPVPTSTEESGVVNIRVYVDYLCPYCKEFEETNAEQLEGYIETGAATVEIHPLAVLTSRAQGYSLRAANAAACVANYSPDRFWEFNRLMFDNQPAEQSSGLDDAAIIDIAEKAGVTKASSIADCVSDQRYKAWVDAATDRVLTGNIPDSNIDQVQGTPIVVVNGKQYRGELDDPSEFAAFVLAQSTGEEGVDAEATTAPTATPAPATAP